MSPLLPPEGLPVDTVLAPYAFCDDVPNVPAVIVPVRSILGHFNLLSLPFHTRC